MFLFVDLNAFLGKAETLYRVPHKITYREYGHGSIVVLLHGYGGSVMHWDPIVERLKESHRVVVPNLTHLYMSENRLLFSRIVEHVSNFIRTQFPGERVSLSGMSFGGALAWAISVKYPELVDKMVLLNPLMPEPISRFRLPETRYFFVLPMDGKAVLRVLASPIGQAFLQRAAGIFRPDREDTIARLEKLKGTKLRFVAEIISHFSWILRNEDWKYWGEQLGGNSSPTLVVWSQDDQLFGEDAYRDLAFSLQAERAVVWPEGGHILSKSKPDEVSFLIEEFLKIVREEAA